jgi:hypothetical protein
MSVSSARSASKKRNPLNDVNSVDDASASGRKSRSSSARKSRISQRGENSIDDASTASAATVGTAQMAELSDLDSSAMSTASGRVGGDQTASLADLAKLMQSPAEEDDDDDKNSRVNSRRQTVDPAGMQELNAMFGPDSDEDEEEEADGAAAGTTVAAVETADVSTFASPPRADERGAAASKVPTPKPLKSCISARKPKSSKAGEATEGARGSMRKGKVRFGSPDAAEFHNDMATSSVTPLPKAFTRQRYQMVSPETQAQAVRAETDENSRILAELSDEDDAVRARVCVCGPAWFVCVCVCFWRCVGGGWDDRRDRAHSVGGMS